MTVRMGVIYSGRVQGVGFRATVYQIAQRFVVSGYVRNQHDGTVELVCEGEEPELLAFLGSIRERFSRHLTSESSHRSEGQPALDDFEIRS